MKEFQVSGAGIPEFLVYCVDMPEFRITGSVYRDSEVLPLYVGIPNSDLVVSGIPDSDLVVSGIPNLDFRIPESTSKSEIPASIPRVVQHCEGRCFQDTRPCTVVYRFE